MAETESHPTKQYPDRGKSNKYFTSFLYKASLALVFLVIIPLFPSQAPEFINQTVPSRSWELLHLVFVGIAVSYGLFSSRNQEVPDSEPNNPSKLDSSAQSYVSRLLQVPSVFEDEPEAQPGSTDEISRLETWSSRYSRNEPVVVLAKEQVPSIVDQRKLGGEKPLLLPVRSLKSRVPDETKVPFDEPIGLSSSNSGSKRFSGSMDSSQKLEEKGVEKESAVLPSPIPWRSRSGRMEVKEGLLGHVSPFSSTEDFDYYGAKTEPSKPQITTPSRTNSGGSSKAYFSPRKSTVSSEAQAKTAEDYMRRRSFTKYSPPPPPPPPPPPKSSSIKAYLIQGSRRDNDLWRSYSGEPREAAPVGKSMRTFRSRTSEKGTGEYDTEEADESLLGKTRRKAEAGRPKPSSIFKMAEEGEDGFVEDASSDSNDDSPASKNVHGAGSGTQKNEEAGSGKHVGDGGGPDVDKKADEFIAKFREQIRLQRIDSIKRSTAEISRNLSK